jgi:tetratricopeptide (TPR) repeat protein
MILNNFGESYLRNEEYEQGLNIVETALEIKPTFVPAIDNKSIALKNLERWDDAIEWYQKAFEISDDLFDLSSKAWCTRQLGFSKTDIESKKQHFDDSMNLYDLVIERDEVNDNAYSNKAMMFYHLQMYGESRKNIEHALKINSSNAGYWGLLGDIEFKMQKYDEALLWYNKSLNIRPNHPWNLNQKGLVLSELGNHEEALDCFDMSIKLQPDAYTLTEMGIQLNNLDRYEEAINYFNQALTMVPDNVNAIGNKSRSLRLLKKYEEALDCINELIKIEPDAIWNTVEKIKIYWDWKKSAEAIVTAEEALRQFPNDGEEILELFITMYRRLGDASKQKEFEEKLQKLRDFK